jgi:dihydropteroate synthase
MSRKHYEWKVRDKTLRLGERTLIMGILNVTPDSFSDGGKYADPDRAFARALELEEQGADIIDIGAESTRPGSARVSEGEELRRLIPVLKRLEGRLTVPLSVDTYKSAVATKALELGADIINDPSGLTFDPDLAKAAVNRNAGLILNHMRGTPETWAKLPPMKDAILTIGAELDSAMHRAVRAGLDRKRIVIDPGLGFGKRKEQNAEILARLDELKPLDLPLLVGASRKHFVAKPSDDETEFASAAAVAAAILYGAHLIRVHDVVAMKAVIEVADEIARARAEREEIELAAKAALREESKRERSSSPRRDATPYRQEASPQKFSVPVVTGVVRPAGFSPLRPTLKRATPPARPIVEKQEESELTRATELVAQADVAQDKFLPSSESPSPKAIADELPGRGVDADDADTDFEGPDDLDLDDEAPLKYAAPAKRESAAPSPAGLKKDREAKGRDTGDEAKSKPRTVRPGGPISKPRFGDDRGARRDGPPARRGAYSRQGPSDDRRPPNRGGASREDGARGERPPFRGKPSFAAKPFGEKPAFGDKSGEKKSFDGKPSFGRKSSGGKPFGDKPFGDRRSGGKPFAGKSFGAKPGSRPAGKFSGEPVGRPGGRPSFGDRPPFGERSSEGRPSGPPRTGKPFAPRGASSGAPFRDRPSGRPPSGRPSFGERSSEGRPSGPPRTGKPFAPRGASSGAPFRDRPSGRPPGGPGGRPSSGRPSGGRPGGARPSSGRPSGGRPSGGRPFGARPSGGKPFGGKPGGKPRGGRPPGRG